MLVLGHQLEHELPTPTAPHQREAPKSGVEVGTSIVGEGTGAGAGAGLPSASATAAAAACLESMADSMRLRLQDWLQTVAARCELHAAGEDCPTWLEAVQQSLRREGERVVLAIASP